MLNRILGLLLILSVVVVGVHSCDNDFAKTNVAITITHSLTSSVVSLPTIKFASAQPCPVYAQAIVKKTIAKKKIFAKTKTHSHKYLVPHHHKSKMQHHHHKHHSHHIPQKIHAHAAPPLHLTSPPGCG